MGTGTISHPNDALFWQSGYYQVVRAGDWKLQVETTDEREIGRVYFDVAIASAAPRNFEVEIE